MRKVVEALVCPEMDQSVIVDVESANLGECFTVDLGQPDEETLTDVADRMRRCAATASTVLSGQAA